MSPVRASINLSWDANTEPDLAGYVVLRGEAPGDTLQPLTPAPITATSYEDKTVQPGVRYVYAIVAIDKATPPISAPPSSTRRGNSAMTPLDRHNLDGETSHEKADGSWQTRTACVAGEVK